MIHKNTLICCIISEFLYVIVIYIGLPSSTTSCTLTTTKDVETIAEVEDGVTGDGIDLTIRPSVGIDGTGEVRLLMKNVIPLEHHGQFLAT